MGSIKFIGFLLVISAGISIFWTPISLSRSAHCRGTPIALGLNAYTNDGSFSGSMEKIEENVLFSGTLPPKGSKTYELIEVESSERWFIWICGKVYTEGARLTLLIRNPHNYTFKPYSGGLSGPAVEEPVISGLWARRFRIVWESGKYSLVFKNPNNFNVTYGFYWDRQRQLEMSNVKSIPVEGGLASFDVRVEWHETLFLTLEPPPNSNFTLSIYEFGYWWGDLVANSTSGSLTIDWSSHPESGARYYIIVKSLKGIGEFKLKATVTSIYTYPAYGLSAFLTIMAVSAIIFRKRIQGWLRRNREAWEEQARFLGILFIMFGLFTIIAPSISYKIPHVSGRMRDVSLIIGLTLMILGVFMIAVFHRWNQAKSKSLNP